MAVYKFISKKGYEGKYGTVNNFIKDHKKEEINKATIRFETNPGLQAQVDWKENLSMVNREKEVFTVNIFLMVLGYSRKKYLKLTSDKTQKTLFQCLYEGFKYFEGVPKEILFDNMATVIDRQASNFSKHKLNKTFQNFSKDAKFTAIVCRPYRAQTKGKVESLSKLTQRLVVYNNEFDKFEELEELTKELMNDINTEISQATNEIPNEIHKKEKEYLSHIPKDNILTSYFSGNKEYKVSKESLVTYKGQKYSVTTKYIGKLVTITEDDNDIKIYYNGDLIESHHKSSNKYNYKREHMVGILASDALRDKSDEDIDVFIENNLSLMNMLVE